MPGLIVTIEDIKKKLNSYKEYSGYIATNCPFHDDEKPSLLIYDDGWFRCLGCHRSGDLWMLERALHGWMPPTIKSEPVSWSHPQIEGTLQEMWLHSHEALTEFETSLGWYLRLRGLEGRIYPNQLGWKNGWYTVPVFNPDFTFRGVVMRAGPHIQKATDQRFWIPPNQDLTLYVPDWTLVNNSKYLVVVYGIFDALTLAELRIPCATGCTGKSINPAFFDDFRVPILVIPDAGEEADAIDLAGKLGWRGITGSLKYPGSTKDPNDYFKAGLRNKLEDELQHMIAEKRL